MNALRRAWAWLLRQVPADQDLEAAEREKRERALVEFHNRRESQRRRNLKQIRGEL